MIRDRGRDSSEESCILIENGRFYGMGYLDKDLQIQDLETLKEQLPCILKMIICAGLVYIFCGKMAGEETSMGV